MLLAFGPAAWMILLVLSVMSRPPQTGILLLVMRCTCCGCMCVVGVVAAVAEGGRSVCGC
eukprot:10620301-Alexandrium_andersonii.AAC.1